MVADDGESDPTGALESAADATTQRLRDLLSEDVPLAEIAVRLGTTLADAKARIDRLDTPPAPVALPRAVPTPAATRAEVSPETPLEASATTPDPRTPATPRPADDVGSKMPRRTFLTLAATALAGLAGGAFLITRPTRSAPLEVRAPRPLPPAPTPTPSPLALLRPAENVFERLAYEPGEAITATDGLFFLRTKGETAGSVEGWRLPAAEAIDEGSPRYQASAGGRFVAARSAIHDRQSGRAFAWPADQLRLAGVSDVAALFETLAPGADGAPQGTGRYVLTNEELQARAEFELEGRPTPGFRPRFEADGRRVFLAIDRREANPTLYLLDGASSSARVVFEPSTPFAPQRVFFAEATPLSDSSAVMLPFSYWPTRPPRPLGYGVFTTFVARLGWDGEQQATTRVGVDRVFLSPDGSQAAGELVIFSTAGGQRRFEPTSTVLVLDGESGRPRFRIRSARLNYGDELGGMRWLADSSALVVQTRIDGDVGYSLVSADGASLERLPIPPGGTGAWFEHVDINGAVPSPEDPNLIAFGRTQVFDRSAPRWQTANTAGQAPAHADPWSGAGDEFMLVLPHDPHEALPLLAELDETFIEHAPFDALG